MRRWLRKTPWLSPSNTIPHRIPMGIGIGMNEVTTLVNTPTPNLSSLPSHQFRWNSISGTASSSANGITREWLAHIWRHEIKHFKCKSKENKRGGQAKSKAPGTEEDNKTGDAFLGSSSSLSQRNLESLLSTNTLVIIRDIEWANVLFSFEQESRYLIMDPALPNSPVGYIRETSNVIYRQLLRSRRPFVAHIIDSDGNEIFRVRRPFWLINSTIFAEVDGKEIGVVHKRWHLWRRIYDLYLGNRQFAVVENPGFWNWTFTLKDEEDNVLAQIDRNWRGIGLELFTDAGQYVIRFGASVPGSYGSDYHIEELDVVRPLNLSERAIALALAVSLDCDYFSRRGGWGLPIIILEE